MHVFIISKYSLYTTCNAFKISSSEERMARGVRFSFNKIIHDLYDFIVFFFIFWKGEGGTEDTQYISKPIKCIFFLPKSHKTSVNFSSTQSLEYGEKNYIQFWTMYIKKLERNLIEENINDTGSSWHNFHIQFSCFNFSFIYTTLMYKICFMLL